MSWIETNKRMENSSRCWRSSNTTACRAAEFRLIEKRPLERCEIMLNNMAIVMVNTEDIAGAVQRDGGCVACDPLTFCPHPDDVSGPMVVDFTASGVHQTSFFYPGMDLCWKQVPSPAVN